MAAWLAVAAWLVAWVDGLVLEPTVALGRAALVGGGGLVGSLGWHLPLPWPGDSHDGGVGGSGLADGSACVVSDCPMLRAGRWRDVWGDVQAMETRYLWLPYVRAAKRQHYRAIDM